jgi:hypothetical protein
MDPANRHLSRDSYQVIVRFKVVSEWLSRRESQAGPQDKFERDAACEDWSRGMPENVLGSLAHASKLSSDALCCSTSASEFLDVLRSVLALFRL